MEEKEHGRRRLRPRLDIKEEEQEQEDEEEEGGERKKKGGERKEKGGGGGEGGLGRGGGAAADGGYGDDGGICNGVFHVEGRGESTHREAREPRASYCACLPWPQGQWEWAPIERRTRCAACWKDLHKIWRSMWKRRRGTWVGRPSHGLWIICMIRFKL